MENRQLIKGNWKCSQCGKDITELPFEPDTRPLFCRECHRVRVAERNNTINEIKENETTGL